MRPHRPGPKSRLLKDRPADEHHPERKGILAALINRDGQGIDPDLRTTIDIKVAKALSRAMEQAGGNVSRAARALGVSRDTLRYRLGKLGHSEAS